MSVTCNQRTIQSACKLPFISKSELFHKKNMKQLFSRENSVETVFRPRLFRLDLFKMYGICKTFLVNYVDLLMLNNNKRHFYIDNLMQSFKNKLLYEKRSNRNLIFADLLDHSAFSIVVVVRTLLNGFFAIFLQSHSKRH